ncbi:MAG: TRAP transporter small permease [Deltaproteobacteria bacterium]|nr:TRAP transporter small permease [Deltaproteobacteria bacterium]MBW2077749.1 TRAP transporter small permease [Deltaproteobacteria bacterium]
MKDLGLAIWKGLLFFQKWFMIVAGFIVTVLVFVEVLLRYVFGSPLFGVEEMVCLIAMWLYFIGASYGAYERSHIKAELVHLWFKTSRSHAFISTISSSITFFLCVLMIKWSYPYFIWGLKKGETSQALLLPMVLSQSAIFFGSILMSLYFLVELVDHIRESLGKAPVFKESSEEEA